jgi:hypothetical protein
LFVPAVPVESYTSIVSPAEAEDGRVKVLATDVSVKYLFPASRVVLPDIIILKAVGKDAEVPTCSQAVPSHTLIILAII